MLNLSQNRIEGKVDINSLHSFSMLEDYRASKIFSSLLVILFFLLFIVMFLPWTQSIHSKGYVTTLQPSQRPQTVHSIIGGRIEEWFVHEGSFVKKGDTILFMSEIKEDYLDPQLLSRTEDQVKAKELTVESYTNKVAALNSQIGALLKTKRLKVEQAKNYIQQIKFKIQSDSIDLQAAITKNAIAQKQWERMELLYKDGLKSLTELETSKLKLQESQAKKISAENKLLSSKNELINAKVELLSVENQYRDKLSKAESEKYTALSSRYDAEAMVTKLQNQYMNYSVRSGLYYVTAPQDGYIIKTIRSGIGETVKEGAELISIMPTRYELAVAMYIRPMDLPLVSKGQDVQFIFDGWPSVAFSGWPNLSYGTFGGKVVAVDNFISENGQYRVLVVPDPQGEKWPVALRVGSGAFGMALLKDVPIWYELWRNFNGFPPDYYQTQFEKKNTHKALSIDK
ncbi:biotin/lipoyl-binding protein [Rapidithrix thailandica]|uniref:Biotin/lipoyl-binding protein n=1 Tax=Rapidithrix thailandica TaxID=413964 RepID=A0AAW9S5D9_9BACT